MKKWQLHTYLTALFPGLPRWDGTRKVKPIWILLKQETVSGSGISWATSAPRSRQITTPATHHSVFTGRMPFPQLNQQRQSTEGLRRINIQDKASENTTKKWQICISDEINEWDKVVQARKWRSDSDDCWQIEKLTYPCDSSAGGISWRWRGICWTDCSWP